MKSGQNQSAPMTRPWPRRELLFAAALTIAVFLAYLPAWNGAFIWDDDAHVTKPELRSWYGLYRIWFDLGATQQYYPLMHSAFWIEHKLWGDSPLGYHLVNIFLHVLVALMVVVLLSKLKIPGAYLAGAIFALHPVQVESVAWITELKNTLSAVLYLAAAWLYLCFDENRKKRFYMGALVVFVLCLLSKTVTATLPAALLVVFWWKRGRLSWRRDVLPLVPFFVLGAAAGLFTAWVERKLIGAEGGVRSDVHRSFPDSWAGNLVLPGQTLLARGPDVHLSALERRSGRMVAISFSHYRVVVGLCVVGAAAALARAIGRNALLRGDTFPGAGILQCISLSLFVRGRSLSISGQPGGDRPSFGRDSLVAGAMSVMAPNRRLCPVRVSAGRLGGLDLAAMRDVQGRNHFVQGLVEKKSGLLDGAYQPGCDIVPKWQD